MQSEGSSIQLQTFSKPQNRDVQSQTSTDQRNLGETGLESTEPAGMELPPVDRGFKAWSFVGAAFVLETIVWGFGFTYGVFQEYFLHHRTFGDASEAAIGAVGTIALATQYFEVMIFTLLALQWPHKIRMMMWASLALCCGSLISHLILLQGVLFGIGGGGLYAPVIIYLSEWFVSRRGLAGSFIFGGSGAGGALFPVAANFLLTNLGFRQMDAPNLGRIYVHFWRTGSFVRATAFAGGPSARYSWVESMDSFTEATLELPEESVVFVHASFAGQIIFGHVCDIAPYGYVIVASGSGAALSAYLLWGFAHNLGLIFAFVVVFGSLSGGFCSVWPAASVEIAGSEQSSVSNIMGFFSMAKGLAAIVGPLVAAALHHPEQAATRSMYSGYGFRDVTLFVGSMMVATA
ncbi:unnamed protein product, partial [Rhizoctonia solani]